MEGAVGMVPTAGTPVVPPEAGRVRVAVGIEPSVDGVAGAGETGDGMIVGGATARGVTADPVVGPAAIV